MLKNVPVEEWNNTYTVFRKNTHFCFFASLLEKGPIWMKISDKTAYEMLILTA